MATAIFVILNDIPMKIHLLCDLWCITYETRYLLQLALCITAVHPQGCASCAGVLAREQVHSAVAIAAVAAALVAAGGSAIDVGNLHGFALRARAWGPLRCSTAVPWKRVVAN